MYNSISDPVGPRILRAFLARAHHASIVRAPEGVSIAYGSFIDSIAFWSLYYICSKAMEYVVLDIETTGLDPQNTSIIEVGALLIEGKAIKKKYSSFVAYSGEIPEAVKRLTGITEDMLRGAPPLIQVIADLDAFIEKRPVVSHNGFAFDFPILEREGLRFASKHDSMEFAFFVLPTNLSGHSMSALAEQFGFLTVQHRALTDCDMEFSAIVKLQEEYSRKPKKIREALKSLAERTGWWWASFLPGGSKQVDLISSLVADYEPYRKSNVKQETIAFETQRLAPDDVEKQFRPGVGSSGDYSEDRPEQRAMAALIAESFNNHRHAVIEAGTGTGKSKAYLVPSLLFALKNKIPLIVSTHTKALQDQLFVKEIPHLKESIHPELQVAVLKGKRNYVCLQKFDEWGDELSQELSQRSLYTFYESGPRFTPKLVYLLLSSWITDTKRGDWEELPYWLRDKMSKGIEAEVCNTDELCGAGTCDLYSTQKCFLAKARLRARDADLVIINHAIALSGIMIPDEDSEEPLRPDPEAPPKSYSHTVFPGEAKFIVFDEAHHLEDDATSAWEQVVSEGSLQLLLKQLYGKRGVIGIVKSIAQQKGTQYLLKEAGSFERAEADTKLLVQVLFSDLLPQLIPDKHPAPGNLYQMLDDIPGDSALKKAFVASLADLAVRLRGINKRQIHRASRRSFRHESLQLVVCYVHSVQSLAPRKSTYDISSVPGIS